MVSECEQLGSDPKLYSACVGRRIHTLGSARRSQSHPDSRAIFFEDVTYSKRKIEDFLSTLGGFKAAQRLLAKVKVTAADFRSVFVYMRKSLSRADALAQQLS